MHWYGFKKRNSRVIGLPMNNYYLQIPLIEYDFRVTDLFQDVQDGVRLCRAIQLLQQESSILMVRLFLKYSLHHLLCIVVLKFYTNGRK